MTTEMESSRMSVPIGSPPVSGVGASPVFADTETLLADLFEGSALSYAATE
ncbi:hypothetical protein D3C81_2139640 [compost metagenome]